MRVPIPHFLLPMVVVLSGTFGIPAAAAQAAESPCPWIGENASADTRAGQVLAQMTLDDKIAMVHGTGGSAYTGYLPGNSRLCIPALKLQDGPVGVRMADTTQLPSAATLAASFDPALAKRYGAVIGAEDKTKGVDVDLGPTINIVRDPRWGRAFESYSEDPYLTGQIGAADIEGIQDQGVMAQVKHYAVYNQETNRNTVSDDAIVDDRTVREIYTSAFGAIVANARPSSAMCSYSLINGAYACENAYLDTILKKDFGFDGFITSDWWGTHSTVASANAGMDMQMPDDTYFGAALKTAVQNGQVAQSRLDDMVTRILREEFRFGLVDHPSADTPTAPAATPAHLTTARTVSEDGTVLLKNDGVLPFDAKKVHSIAVIGDGAGPNTMTHGGGSAVVNGTGTVTPYDGIKARAGSGVNVEYAQGDLPSSGQLPTIDSQYLSSGAGLQGQYFDNMTLSGTPVATRTDPTINYTWSDTSPIAGLGNSQYSVKWTGTLTAPTTGTYTLGVTSDDGSRLFVNGQQVIDNWRNQGPTTETAQVPLTAGEPVQIEVDYYQDGGGAVVGFGWLPPSDLLGDATALAEKSDVAVVYANDFESEGDDLTDIDLPADQNTLISAVAAANPNTIVVLNTGSAVTMPWLGQVKGVLEAWYPGQESGNAIASLLFGDRNPSGKLPVTFPVSLAQVPASTPEQWPGTNGKVHYSEKLDVGYRWYDDKGLTPLFPFGYGLSYTDFKVGRLALSSRSLTENGRLQASVDVTNTGSRAGAEVVQLYLSDPAAAGEPANQLKAFAKVSLAPHQTKRVRLTLSAHDASYWNTDAQAWTLAAGTYSVRVGTSSRSLPLTSTFRVTHTTGPRYTKVTAPELAKPGSAVAVTTAFTNGATVPVLLAHTTLALPSGWSAKALTSTSYGLVRPGQTVTARWTVTIAADAAGGTGTIKATTRYLGSDRLPAAAGTATVNIAYPSLAAAFNLVAVSDDADPAAANFDGSGYSYSAQALATAGVTPGGTVGGFTWPDVAAGKPDAVTTQGQVVVQGGSGSTLNFLLAGSGATQQGTVTVTYTDGTTSSGTITGPDWYNTTAAPGSSLVVTAPYWNRPAGSTLPADHQVSIFASSVPLTAGKTVAYVGLPSNNSLHVFATNVS